MTLAQLLLFFPTAVLLALAPGPDNLGVLALGVSVGRRASLGFALGCAAGCINHTLLAAIGVSALLAASPVALHLMQWSGAAYLAWIGVQSLRSLGSAQPATLHAHGENRFRPHFVRGVIANAINPKVVLFFLAFLPQFLVKDGWLPGIQLAVLGSIFALVAAASFATIAACSGWIGQRLARTPLISKVLNLFTALVFIGLAVRLLLADIAPTPSPVR